MEELGGLMEAALASRGGKRHGDEINFRCPAHEDDNPSADWNRKKNAWHCIVCGASGSTRDLAVRLGIPVPERRQAEQVAATYDYRDASGKLLYQKVRLVPKSFRLRRPDGAGGWRYDMEGTTRVLYRLPELLASGDATVYLVEGEKDADNLAARGLVATTAPDGASKGQKQKWLPHYNQWLASRDVVVIPDNDEAGRALAAFVAGSLRGTARSVRVLALPDLAPKGDVSDWLLSGGSTDELVRLAAGCPEWEPPAEPQGISAYPLTDAGNGEVFAALYGDRVRYDWQRGRWLVWGQHRWQQDPDGELYRLAKAAARARWKAAVDVEDGDRRSQIAKWAIASESEGKLTAALQRARSEHPIADSGAGWDTQPLLLACSNGVVNLVTGELRQGRPEDRLTMGSGLPFEPAAACPRWERFLEEVLPDPAVREFVRLAIGYSLTGLAREQVWFLCYGTGANGKGTLFDVLRWALGDLAHVMAFSTIERGKEQSIASDMAALQGKRLVVTSETQEHSRFNEARIKSLTGEDAITARELYQRQFTFEPVLKLWVGVNHKPVVTDDSYGFWRRVRLIPFSETFDDARRDDGLREELKRELVGILAWCVRAAVDWSKRGLPVPPAIAIATVEYREESDPFGNFIADRCAVRDDAEVGASALYRAYKAWAEGEGMRDREIISATAFGRRMAERFKRHKTMSRNVYLGVGLLSDGYSKPSMYGGFMEGFRILEGFSGKSSPAIGPRVGDFPERAPNPPYPPSPETAAKADCCCDSCGCPDEACSTRDDGLEHCDRHHPAG